jgi:alpha-beta hydrolase superfamily lysophospholipase
MARLRRWCTRRRLIVAAVVLFVFPNAVAYMHARALTHYVTGAGRPAPLRTLGLWPKAKLFLTGVTLPRPENTHTPADVDLPFTTHAVAAGGVTLEAWHVPADAARGLVLLFHGHATCKASLLREAAYLREAGYSSFLVDFRGSGGSSGSVTTIGVREADDVAAAVDYCRYHWPGQRLALFGQSMGAAAILRAVATGTETDAVMLECPFDRMLGAVERRFELAGVPPFPLARLLTFWGGVQNGFDAFAHNPVEYAAAVRCPALLMHGGRDPLVHTSEAADVFDALAGPKRWELFAEAGHQSYCFKCPDRWAAVVGEFLGDYLK